MRSPIYLRDQGVAQSDKLKITKIMEAIDTLRAQLGTSSAIAQAEPGNLDDLKDTILTHGDIAEMLVAMGKPEKAPAELKLKLALYDKALTLENSDMEYWRGEIVATHERIAGIARDARLFDIALAAALSIRDLRMEAAKKSPDAVDEQLALVTALRQLSAAYLDKNDTGNARTAAKDALAIAERIAVTNPEDSNSQIELALSYAEVGRIESGDGRPGEAVDANRKALAVRERQAAKFPDDADGQHEVAKATGSLALALDKSGDRKGALATLRRGQSVVARLAGNAPANDEIKTSVDWFAKQIADLER